MKSECRRVAMARPKSRLRDSCANSVSARASWPVHAKPRTRFNVSVRPSPTGSAGLNLWTIRWRAAGFSRVSSLVKVKEVVEVHESGEEKFEGINSVFFEGLWIRIRIGCDNNYDVLYSLFAVFFYFGKGRMFMERYILFDSFYSLFNFVTFKFK